MDNILVIINKINNNNLMDYLNLSTLFGKIIDFVENILSAHNFNNNIIINISSLVIKIQIIKIKLN